MKRIRGDGRRSLFARSVLPLAVLLVAVVFSGAWYTFGSRGPTPAAAVAVGRTFYVSPGGDDRKDGTSPDAAWRTLDRVDVAVLKPGDRVLLQGGARFAGTVILHGGEAGSASAPVVVGSYGTGRATIVAAGASGISVDDTAGVEIHHLVVVGDAAAYQNASGIRFFSDLPDDQKLDHVVVAGVDVSGFADGVEIGGGRGTTGFRDVEVRDSALHGNRDAGLASYGPAFDAVSPGYAHEDVSVTRVSAYDNLGDPDDHIRNTGSGIVLGSVRGGTIAWSSAYGNGLSCDAPEGPVGIWSYDSTDVLIEHDVAHDNHTSGPADGGGFDLDQNMSASTVQYNLSYDNDGPGYLLYTGRDDAAFTGDTVRFNISSGDGDARAYGGLVLWGRISDTQVYQNTVAVTSGGPMPGPALRILDGLSNVAVRNNVLVSDGQPLVNASSALSPAQVVFQGNDYFSGSGPWTVDWGISGYSSLPAWRSASGQELVGDGTTGLTADPGFTDASVEPAAGLATAFVPRPGSPVVDRALDLRALFGVDRGPVDYFGRRVGPTAAVGAAGPEA